MLCNRILSVQSASKTWRSTSGALLTAPARCVSQLASGRTAPAPQLCLQPGEVHIWWLSSEHAANADLLRRCTSILSSAELAAMQGSASNVRLQRQRLLARALVRWTLSRYVGGVPAEALCFGANPYGKPHLTGPPPASPTLHFNLSHTSSLIGCAVSREAPVGLDVESCSRRPANLLRLAQRRFAPSEYQALLDADDAEQRRQLFLQLWTLKEAFVKAKGIGINAPPGLKGFSVGLQRNAAAAQKLSAVTGLPAPASDALGISLSCSVAQDQSHELLLLQPNADHVAALCMQQPMAGSDPTAPSAESPLMRVRMWQCVPVAGELGTALTSARAIGCTLGV